MKKNILVTLCLFFNLNGMEEQQLTKREPHEWDARAYAQGNQIQETAALTFLRASGINLANKKILDVGCGTGNITALIAQTAKRAHGIDASKNMSEHAKRTYENRDNLSFEQCFAEDYITKKPFDIAVSFFCIQYIENKQKALQNINRALSMNGEFIGNMHTAADPEHLNVSVALEMIPGLKQTLTFIQNIDFIKEIGLFDQITDEEVRTMFISNGFEMISYKHITSEHILKDRAELEAYSKPLVMSRPIIKKLPESLIEWLFTKYIDLYVTKLKQNEDGHYIFPAICTTVFHARKITDI